MVNVGTGGTGTRFIKTDWPIEEGLTAGTTKLSDDYFLIPEYSICSENDGVGL